MKRNMVVFFFSEFFELLIHLNLGVKVLMEGNEKTFSAFLTCNSRFHVFLKQQKNLRIDEALLIQYYEEFVFRLTHRDSGTCVWGPGSFFSVLSHAKRYLLLRYEICFPTKVLSSMLKKAKKHHKPKKSLIFTSEEIAKYLSREQKNGGDFQKSLIVAIAFFGLGRREEVGYL
jgi:hypothetical protein